MAEQQELQEIIRKMREEIIRMEKQAFQTNSQVSPSELQQLSEKVQVMGEMMEILRQKLDTRYSEDPEEKDLENDLWDAFKEYVEVHKKQADLKLAKHFRPRR